MDLLGQVHQRVDGGTDDRLLLHVRGPGFVRPLPGVAAGSRRRGSRPATGSPGRGRSPAGWRSGPFPRGRGDAPSQRSISRRDPQRSRLRGPPHAATSPSRRCRPRWSDRRSFPTQCKADGGSSESNRCGAGPRRRYQPGAVVELKSVHGREPLCGHRCNEKRRPLRGRVPGHPHARHSRPRDHRRRLQLVVAFRRQARQRGGPLPSIDAVDALLDERIAAIFAIPQ